MCRSIRRRALASAGYCYSGTGTAATACYLYDAQGRRVYRSGYVIDTCDTDGIRATLYDLADRPIVEAFNATNCDSEIYAGSRHLANQGGGTFFAHADWLGTLRLEVWAGQPGNSWYYRYCSSLPFGESLGCKNSGGVANITQSLLHFTGKPHDQETNLDYFGARFDSSSFGRFMSPDAANVGAASTDPQSWNGYAYAGNNATNNTDPNGRDYYVCINNDQGGQNCKTVGNDAVFLQEVKDSPGVSLQDGKILANGQEIGTYQHFIGPGNEGTSEDTILAPTIFFAGVSAARSAFRAGIGLLEDLFGAGGRTGAETISGFASTGFGTVTREALEAAANSGGPTVRLVTNLTQAPLAGRALSTAAGEGAEALANAAREGGTTFVANVPKALIDQMTRAGLVEIRTTSSVGGAVAQELRFAPQASEFVVKFFRAVH